MTKTANKAKPKEAILIKTGDQETYQGYPVIKTLTGAIRILIIEEGATPKPQLFSQGFRWLDRWDMIAPFRPYRELAADLVKGKTEKEIATLQIGDLRVPVFDPRLVFIKSTPETRKLWEIYEKHKNSWDPRIAFLAAVWETKPLIKPLPAGRWIDTNG